MTYWHVPGSARNRSQQPRCPTGRRNASPFPFPFHIKSLPLAQWNCWGKGGTPSTLKKLLGCGEFEAGAPADPSDLEPPLRPPGWHRGLRQENRSWREKRTTSTVRHDRNRNVDQSTPTMDTCPHTSTPKINHGGGGHAHVCGEQLCQDVSMLDRTQPNQSEQYRIPEHHNN